MSPDDAYELRDRTQRGDSTALGFYFEKYRVGDEPRDVVFAGERGERAFITTAHRGKNSPVDRALVRGRRTGSPVLQHLGSDLDAEPLADDFRHAEEELAEVGRAQTRLLLVDSVSHQAKMELPGVAVPPQAAADEKMLLALSART